LPRFCAYFPLSGKSMSAENPTRITMMVSPNKYDPEGRYKYVLVWYDDRFGLNVSGVSPEEPITHWLCECLNQIADFATPLVRHGKPIDHGKQKDGMKLPKFQLPALPDAPQDEK